MIILSTYQKRENSSCGRLLHCTLFKPMFVYVVYWAYQYLFYCLPVLISSNYKKCQWSIYHDGVGLTLKNLYLYKLLHQMESNSTTFRYIRLAPLTSLESGIIWPCYLKINGISAKYTDLQSHEYFHIRCYLHETSIIYFHMVQELLFY